MFHFGSHDSVAELYWDRAAAVSGPKLARMPIDEMSVNQLKTALVYARMACSLAVSEGANRSVIDILVGQHDLIFEALVDCSNFLQEAIKKKTHKFLGGYDKDNIQKYLEMAGLAA